MGQQGVRTRRSKTFIDGVAAELVALMAAKERSRPAVGIVLPPPTTATVRFGTRISSKPRISLQNNNLEEIRRSRGLDFYKGERSPARGRDERSEYEWPEGPDFRRPYTSPEPSDWLDPQRPVKLTGKYKKYRRRLLRERTPTEAYLHPLLCNQAISPHGIYWRFQSLLLWFFPDFILPKYKLILEVDGSHHKDLYEQDLRRDSQLADAGYIVLRFSNWLARNNTSGLLAELEDLILYRHIIRSTRSRRTRTCHGHVRHYVSLPYRKPQHLGSSSWLNGQR
jgi:very-short-patch-repair endonuclease